MKLQNALGVLLTISTWSFADAFFTSSSGTSSNLILNRMPLKLKASNNDSSSMDIDERRKDIQARLALEGERLRRLQMEAEQMQQQATVSTSTDQVSTSSSGSTTSTPLIRKNRPMTSIERKRLEALLSKEEAMAMKEMPSGAPSSGMSTSASTTAAATASTAAAVPTSESNASSNTSVTMTSFAEDMTRPMTTVERKRLEAQRFRDKLMGTTTTTPSTSSSSTSSTATPNNATMQSTEEIYAQAYKKAYEDAYQKSFQEFQSKLRAQEPTVVNDIQKVQQEAAAARQAEAERLRKSLYETRPSPKPVFQTSYPRPAPPLKSTTPTTSTMTTTGKDVNVQLKDSTGSVTKQVKFPADLVVAAAIPSTVAGAIYLRSSLESRPEVKKEKEMSRASVQIQTSADKIESAATKIEKSADKIDDVEKRWSSASSYLDGLRK